MKLTKEQADWLQSVFDKETAGIRELAPYDIRVILHKITEKEFPEFEMNVYEPNEIENNEIPDTIQIKQRGDYTAAISFIYSDKSGLNRPFEFLIPVDKFKSFNEYCNKIVGWLNEQA